MEETALAEILESRMTLHTGYESRRAGGSEGEAFSETLPQGSRMRSSTYQR
jgi:hypothetical protein